MPVQGQPSGPRARGKQNAPSIHQGHQHAAVSAWDGKEGRKGYALGAALLNVVEWPRCIRGKIPTMLTPRCRYCVAANAFELETCPD